MTIDRCRYPADAGLIGGFEEPGAGFLQRIVQPLHLWPLVGDVDDGAVVILDRAAAGCRQRIQDRIQLGTDGVGESACQMPHAVAALLQLQIPAVLLQLIIDRVPGRRGRQQLTTAWANRRSSGGAKIGGVFGEQLLGG